jgi:aspartate dehydrogenase
MGLIGCGAIGRTVLRSIAGGCVPAMEIVGVTDLEGVPVESKVGSIPNYPLLPDVDSLLNLKPDLIVEAASVEAARLFASDVIASGADLMIVSVGALADAEFFCRLVDMAKRANRRLHVPSGAIGGVDIIKAAIVGGLSECRLTTTKPPQALIDVCYIREQGINLESLDEAALIFEGTAREAVRFFPHNLNVAATISLAGLGLDRTIVRIVADPNATRNVHEIFVRGNFGEATVRLVNQPSADNPKSSYLASLSVIATLQRISQEFQLGT